MRCSICSDLRRDAIDKAICSDSIRNVAKRFDVGPSAIFRHKSTCIAANVRSAQEKLAIASGSTVITELARISKEVELILVRAKRDRDGELCLKALAMLERHAMLRAKLTGEFDVEQPAAARTGGPVQVIVEYYKTPLPTPQPAQVYPPKPKVIDVG